MGVKGVVSIVLLVCTFIIMIGLWWWAIFELPRDIALSFGDKGAPLPADTQIVVDLRKNISVMIGLGVLSIIIASGLVAKEDMGNETVTLVINAAALALALLAFGLARIAVFPPMRIPDTFMR